VRILTAIIAAFFIMTVANTFAQSISDATDTDIVERINFIQHELDSEKIYATAWTGGWTVFNAGSAAFFYHAASHTRNKAHQVTDMVIGVGSTLATIGNLATPLVSMYAPYFLEDMPDVTREQKIAKLNRAEEYLKRGSDLEEFGTSWISQSINIATATAGAFVVGSVYRKRMERAGKSPSMEAFKIFGECFISGEIQILSQPMKLVTSQKKYNQKYGVPGSNTDNEVRVFAYPIFEERYGMVAGVMTTF